LFLFKGTGETAALRLTGATSTFALLQTILFLGGKSAVLQDPISLEDLPDRADELGTAAADILFRRNPDLGAASDPGLRRFSILDLAHHARYIGSACLLDDEAALRDYLKWLVVLFETKHFETEALDRALSCLGEAAGILMSAADAARFGAWISRATALWPELIHAPGRYALSDAQENENVIPFVTALLDGRRDIAKSLVDSLVSEGGRIQDLFVDLFGPAQYEIGRLWHHDRISVAQEHFATAAAQYIISTLYPVLFSRPPSGDKTIIAACAQGELHELGIRMVADCFQAEGWDSAILGANLPVSALVSETQRREPDIVALSATLPVNVRWIVRAVASLKALGTRRPRIIVGGMPFLVSPELWRKVGADAWAADCIGAVAVGERLLA